MMSRKKPLSLGYMPRPNPPFLCVFLHVPLVYEWIPHLHYYQTNQLLAIQYAKCFLLIYPGTRPMVLFIFTLVVVSACFHTFPACSRGAGGFEGVGHSETRWLLGPGPFVRMKVIPGGGMD